MLTPKLSESEAERNEWEQESEQVESEADVEEEELSSSCDQPPVGAVRQNAHKEVHRPV
jgi:hypothetical protein